MSQSQGHNAASRLQSLEHAPTSSKNRLWAGVLLCFAVLIGTTLRYLAVHGQALWHDEFYTLGNLVGFDVYLFGGADLQPVEEVKLAGEWASQLDKDLFWPNLARNLVHEGHPPVYPFALKFWVSLFGFTPAIVRYFSLICSLFTLPIVFSIGRTLAGRSAGLMAVLLFAVLPFQVFYSAEGRSYALLMLCAAAATWAAIRLAGGSTTRVTKLVWVVGVAATGLTHYFGTLYCILLLVTLTGLGAFRTDVSRGKTHWALILSPFFLNALWLPVWVAQMGAHGGTHWTTGAYGFGDSIVMGFTGIGEYLSGVRASAPIPERYFVGLTLVVTMLGFAVAAESQKAYAKRFFVLVALHVLVVAIADQVLNHHLSAVPRYSACLAVLVPVLVAVGLTNLGRSGIILATIFCLIGGRASWLTAGGARAPKQDLAGAAHFIETHASAEDVVIVTPSGPSLIGMGFYLPAAFKVGAVPADQMGKYIETARRNGVGNVWHVQQRLGLAIEYDVSTGPPALATTRFVGVDVALY